MNKFSFLLVLISCAFTTFLSAQSLRINEVSQGTSGSKEYVELLVTGPALTNCSDQPQCLDLRGWILDDNNGYFSNGVLTGTGLASGAIRFANMPFWSCVNPGTIIVIYNDNDINAEIPAIDQDINDGNCTLVLPVSSGLFERHDSAPNNTSMLYSATGWVSGGSWTPISMANGDDSFQIYAPTNTTVPVHGVSWGNNNSNNYIYFSGSAAGRVFSGVNGTSTDLNLQANWSSDLASSGQTPGVPNSTANAALVGGMNLNCSAPLAVTVNPVDESCSAACSGAATLTIEGGQTPYNTPVWSNGTTAAQVSGLCPGNYSVDVTDANGCSTTETFTISSSSGLTLSTSGNVTICPGQSTTISASGATTYTWDNGLGAGSSFSVSPASTTTYNVTGTSGACTASASITVTVNTTLQVSAGSNQTVCAGAQVTLTATGATTYVWNNGVTNSVAFLPPAGATVYTVTGTSGSCTGTSSVTVTVNPLPVVDAGNPQTICAGASVTLTGSGATTYSWDQGVTNGQAFTPSAGAHTYTVTGTTNNCSATDQVTVTVNAAPIVNAGTDQAVCTGASVTLTATGATTYSWDNGVVNGQAFTPAAGTTVYTVTGTASGCSATDQVSVTVTALPQVDAGADQWACLGNGIVLTATGATTYVWDHNVTNGTGFVPGMGAVTYTVTGTTNGCSATDQVTVTVGEPIDVNAGPDLMVCKGESITLTATGATTYTWTEGIINGQPFVPSGLVNTYTVSGVTGVCVDQDEVTVIVGDCGWELEMPNVFTPNGDQQNDIFVPVQQQNVTVKQFRIFNRWGNQLYESNTPTISWDGKAQSGTQATNGTYFYILTFLDGTQQEQTMQGFFNLISE